MLQDIANSPFKPLLSVFFPIHEFLHDGRSRYFWLYMVTGIVLAWLICVLARKDEKGWKALFERETWMSVSARNDYMLLVLRPVLGFTILSWALVNGSAVANWVASVLRSIGVSGAVTDGWTLFYTLLLTLSLFLVDDFLKWAAHLLFHRVPLLWEYHKVHHSAEVLNFTTAERFHPFEAFLGGAVAAIGVGTVNGIFIALVGHKLTPMTLASANILLFTANIFGGVLRHSPCWVAFPPAIERWVVSPAMHQIHHSAEQRHWDTNMGVTLSIWDRWAGTYLCSEGQTVSAYGIGEETREWRSMEVILFRPLIVTWRAVMKLAHRRAERAQRPAQFGRAPLAGQ